MANQSASRWRRHADRVIAGALLNLPADMPAAEKRRVISRDYYPFGERAMTPYKHWCQALNAALPREQVPPDRVLRSLSLKGGVPANYLPFLEAMLAAPDDDAPRLIFADFLEERGDGNAAGVREPEVSADAVAARAFGRGTRLVHVGGTDVRRRVRSAGGADICAAAVIDDHIAGRCLLAVPEVAAAVRVERTLAALRLFGEVKESR